MSIILDGNITYTNKLIVIENKITFIINNKCQLIIGR